MSGETIVITRPQGDERALTDLLHQHGYRVIHEPLTHIFLRHSERQAVIRALSDEPDACIVTSRHGIQALAALYEVRDISLICVGEATARTAESLGFTRIAVAGGNVKKLTEFITASYDEGSNFVYVSGEHVSLDLTEALGKFGMQVERLAIYDAVASEQLSDTLIEQLKRKQLDAITFLSSRSSQIFCELAVKAGAESSLSNLHGFCMSGAVAEPLLQYPWKKLHVTHEPTLASLLESVDNVFT